MRLVVDSNVVFSALIRAGLTRHLFQDGRLDLFVPDYFFEELFKYASEFASRIGVSRHDFLNSVMAFSERLSVVSESSYASFTARAASISPDPNDVDFFALALSLNCPIWSQDRKLKLQFHVPVYQTIELAELLK